MKNKTHLRLMSFLALLMTFLFTACAKDWKMDYGKSQAHFNASDVATKEKPFMGKKITVKGKLLRAEDKEDGNHIYMEHGVHCVFPTWHWGEDRLKPGDEIYVDGILVRCASGDVLLQPALMKDPAAPFDPME